MYYTLACIIIFILYFDKMLNYIFEKLSLIVKEVFYEWFY